MSWGGGPDLKGPRGSVTTGAWSEEAGADGITALDVPALAGLEVLELSEAHSPDEPRTNEPMPAAIARLLGRFILRYAGALGFG